MDSLGEVKQLQKHDEAAFRALLLDYGRRAFDRLTAPDAEHAAVLAAIRAAYARFCAAPSEPAEIDAWEIFISFAQEELSRAQALRQAPRQDAQVTAYNAGAYSAGAQKERRVRGLHNALAIAGLSIAILAALWMIAGLLMDLGFLPRLDLGYSWFSANVLPWF